MRDDILLDLVFSIALRLLYRYPKDEKALTSWLYPKVEWLLLLPIIYSNLLLLWYFPGSLV
jgi:hypothetical protein